MLKSIAIRIVLFLVLTLDVANVALCFTNEFLELFAFAGFYIVFAKRFAKLLDGECTL